MPHYSLFPLFAFSPDPGPGLAAAGAALAGLGLVMLLSSGLRVLKAFCEQRLLSDSVVVYVLFRLLVPAENRWLKEKFGERYAEYRRQVLVKFF